MALTKVKSPGIDTNIDIAGTLDVTNAAVFDSTGTFVGNVQTGGDPNDGTDPGVKLLSTGLVQAARNSSSGSSAVWLGYTEDTATATSRIDADGDASFAGNLRVGDMSLTGSQALMVYEADNEWTAKFTNAHSSTPYGILINYSADNPNTNAYDYLYCNAEEGGSVYTYFRVFSNGGIANYQSNDSNLCDEREKKNIVSLDTKWDKVKSWELKKFHYNEDADTDDLRYGIIAQQVEAVCPEVITDWEKQRAEDAVLDEDDNVVTPAKEQILRKGVKEQQMMWMAIKALQEAMAKIETLEAKVKALENA